MMRRTKHEQFNRDLPEGIMVDILMRLPSESILSLKCVSTQWKRVIDDPYFLNRYGVDKAVTFPAAGELHCLSLIDNITTDFHHPPFSVRHIPSPAVGPKEYLNTKSVCNGMACYYRFSHHPGGQFLFYNLLTGASHTLNNAPLLKYAGDDNDDATWPWFCYGFGYDSYDEDYKMMAVCKYNFDMSDAQTEDYGVFWIYSFKKGEWVRRVGFPHASYDWLWVSELPIACAFNGKLHWIVSRSRSDPRNMYKNIKAILTYDLHTSGFGEKETPNAYVFEFPEGNLKELGGRLCYWACCYEKVDVWVSEDGSWTRLLRMIKSGIARLTYINHMIEPVMVYECHDGRKLVLFISRRYESLYWYDVDNDEVVKVVRQSTWRKTRVVGLRQPKACTIKDEKVI